MKIKKLNESVKCEFELRTPVITVKIYIFAFALGKEYCRDGFLEVGLYHVFENVEGRCRGEKED